jgi:triacylglycerol esterase/lipase EstA (alpha/beta hydrolase family)
MLEGLSPQRRWFVLGCAVVAVVVVLLVVVAAGRGRGPRASGGVPVVLVHGYGGSPASMATLASALRHQHRQVDVVALPQQGRADITRSAQVVSSAVDRTGAAQVDLVGFSAGSIVVRAYMSTPQGADKTRRVVLLGAPNHGADLATLAVSTDPSSCVDACLQLAHGSGFLRDLNSRPLRGPLPVVSIWSADDKVVTPPRSAILPGATNIRVQSVCSAARLAHGDLVTDPVAIGLTLVALEGQSNELEGCAQVRAVGVDALS